MSAKDQPRELALESLLGRRVVDADGVPLGAIEEVVAEWEQGTLVVRAFMLGRHALVARVGGSRLAASLARLLLRDRGYEGLIVPWDAMDLRDPSHPVCTLRRDEVRAHTHTVNRDAGGVASGNAH